MYCPDKVLILDGGDECLSGHGVARRPKFEPLHGPTEITLSTMHRPPPGNREADRWRLIVRG